MTIDEAIIRATECARGEGNVDGPETFYVVHYGPQYFVTPFASPCGGPPNWDVAVQPNGAVTLRKT